MINKEEIMEECVSRALQAKGNTLSNPLVGAAVVNDDKIFYGIHEKYGSHHAEVNAINSAGALAKGAELFVTLEPCSTTGKTPPCVNKIIASNIKKVYVGVLDPNPYHAGNGIRILKDAGIDVEVGIIPEKCGFLIEDFIKFHKKHKPYVSLKTATSIDGRIATKDNHSKWITGVAAREKVHSLRSESDVVITGIGTLISDDPMLNDRRKSALKQPVRAVIDYNLDFPLSSQLAKTAHDIPVICFTSANTDKTKAGIMQAMGVSIVYVKEDKGKLILNDILDYCYHQNFMNVLVEAGSSINGSFFDAGLVDKLYAFIAPKIIGGRDALSSIGGAGISNMSEACNLLSYDISLFDNDILITGRLKDYVNDVVRFTKEYRV